MALSWKIICNLGDPMSRRHTAPKSWNCKRTSSTTLTTQLLPILNLIYKITLELIFKNLSLHTHTTRMPKLRKSWNCNRTSSTTATKFAMYKITLEQTFNSSYTQHACPSCARVGIAKELVLLLLLNVLF